ncbi:YafY family transcriptional regulator [Paenibacillus sp. N1-5-1-14]|uniref:helix-turn-helix transcriptional regulator n=1 Tax=Paenibacillus radicibacter TaxID=2972488 RepID=UPI0021591685|nr:YafY family protein [Paenibacillus radicibacter]MCR8644677.1 YafY family transcriptional regulator [Paenibacillus radicibacter]
MKMDRLLGIIMMLVNRRMIQAKELADMFEVSVRTIYRDVDTINQAGIPVITYQGVNGGIGIAEGYRLDKNLLTNDELAAIVTALQSVSTTHPSRGNQVLLEKMNSFIPEAHAEAFHFKTKQLFIDFSPWGHTPWLEDAITLLRAAIEQRKHVSFTYCSANGDRTSRTVEPYTLVLKSQKWYLYAYCNDREAFRFFKLFRIKELQAKDTMFTRQDIDLQELPWDNRRNDEDLRLQMKLRFDEKIKHMAEEWFGAESLQEEERGKYVVQVSFPEDNWLYGFILSFGQHVEVIEPAHLRNKIKQMVDEMKSIYET